MQSSWKDHAAATRLIVDHVIRLHLKPELMTNAKEREA